MHALDLVGLTPLMRRSGGAPWLAVGLIDGPVDIRHADLAARHVRQVGAVDQRCRGASRTACLHGTQVALMLAGPRGGGICPDASLLVRPIFADDGTGTAQVPRATADQLAEAIADCVTAGAHVVNISAGLMPSLRSEHRLEEALNHAAARDVLVVAAAGNHAAVASSALTRHRAVLSVAACDLAGIPLAQSNLCGSIGRAGLLAPGVGVASSLAGTSAAAPFVTGAIALLWSEFRGARAAEIRYAMMRTASGSRRSVAPRLLNAWAAFLALQASAPRSMAS